MTVTVTTDRASIREAIRGWLIDATGLDRWIWLDQRTPRPQRPYGTVFVPSGSVKSGFDEERARYNDTTLAIERTVAGPRLLTLQVEVYTAPSSDGGTTPEAQDLLENALLALDTIGVRDRFRAAKIGVISQGPAMRFDEQLGERWERRAMAEVTISYSGETFDDGGGGTGNWIETADVPSDDAGTADYGLS